MSSSYLIIILIVSVVAIYILTFLISQNKKTKKVQQKIIEQINQMKNENGSETHSSFDEWLGQQEEKYIKQYVYPAWSRYYTKYIEDLKVGNSTSADIYDYFTEHEFISKYGNRSLVEFAPGVFLSLGLLGTFLGIAVGISGLDLNLDSEGMKNGINELLGSMSNKFAASIAGISASLIWQFFDKKFIEKQLTTNFLAFREQLDKAFPIIEEKYYFNKILENQEQQMQDMQTYISEQLIPQMMSGFTGALSQTILPTLVETQESMQRFVEHTTMNQVNGMKEMASEMMSSFSDITGEQMKDLSNVLKDTVEWQKRVSEEMNTLVESIQSTAINQKEMVQQTTSLLGELVGYTDKVQHYQEQINDGMTHIIQQTEQNKTFNHEASNLVQLVITEREKFDEQFEQQVAGLKDNLQLISKNIDSELQLQKELSANINRIEDMTESQTVLTQSLNEFAITSNKITNELNDVLDKFIVNSDSMNVIHEKVEHLFDNISEERERADKLVTHIETVLSEQVIQMDEKVATLSHLWEENRTTLHNLTKQFGTSMNQFTQDMHTGVTRTFEQFDEELGKSIKYLSNGVNAMREGLIDLPESIDKLKDSVREINKQLDKIS